MSQQQTLYYGGTIITMARPAEAVLTEGERILAVGKESELRRLAGADVHAVSLKGRVMLPAFVDAHSHITAFAATLSLVPLGRAASFEELLALLREGAHEHPDREWVIGFGYDHTVLKEGVHPTRVLLDAAFPDRPVLLSHASGHMGVANAEALRRMGIDRDTPDPEGGRLGRGEDGAPNGYLEEAAFMRYSQCAPAAGPEQIAADFAEAQQRYLRYGITTAQEGFARKGELALLEAMAERQLLTLDVIAYCDMTGSETPISQRQYGGLGSNRLRLGGYKTFLDGSPQGKTAWLTRPYEGEESYRGYPAMEDEALARLVRRACGERAQLLVHCNGDAAADQMIAAFERESERGTVAALRPVMIHAQTVRLDQLERMRRLGMIPSFFAAHIWYWGDIHRRNLGERALRISPLHDAASLGMPFTLHQDSPVLPPDMLETVWCAVNRISRAGVSMGEAQRITPMQALRAVTQNAAYQYFEEEEKGSIEPGKRADFVLLERSPLTVAPDDIRRIAVTETVLRGETVYQA